jgi:peptidoglycan/xylan/chitin deacetylase (PgdA/CDA1 family)
MLPRRLYLTCHGLGTPDASFDAATANFWLTAEVFERTLDVAAQLAADTGIDVRFTFDDGNRSDHAIALPVLMARNRSATFFVCSSRIGQPGYLSAPQLRDLVAAGMTIGSHGHEHVNWRSLADDELARQLKRSRQGIEDVVGHPVDRVSAPFGELDSRVVRAAVTEGFRCLFASSGGFATAETGLIPRNTLKSNFVPERDLPRMAALSQRAWDGVYDRARRMKYRFF